MKPVISSTVLGLALAVLTCGGGSPAAPTPVVDEPGVPITLGNQAISPSSYTGTASATYAATPTPGHLLVCVFFAAHPVEILSPDFHITDNNGGSWTLYTWESDTGGTTSAGPSKTCIYVCTCPRTAQSPYTVTIEGQASTLYATQGLGRFVLGEVTGGTVVEQPTPVWRSGARANQPPTFIYGPLTMRPTSHAHTLTIMACKAGVSCVWPVEVAPWSTWYQLTGDGGRGSYSIVTLESREPWTPSHTWVSTSGVNTAYSATGLVIAPR